MADYAPSPVAALDAIHSIARAVVKEWQEQPGVVHSSMLSSALEDLDEALRTYDDLLAAIVESFQSTEDNGRTEVDR